MSTDMTGEAVPFATIDHESICEAISHMKIVLGAFQTNLDNAAAFRHFKATQYPDDKRNLESAVLLERLASEFSKLPAKELTIPFAFAQGDGGFRESEIIHEYLGRVGFDHFPADAAEMVRDLTAKLTREVAAA